MQEEFSDNVPLLYVLNQLTNFHEARYKWHTTGNYPTSLPLNNTVVVGAA
jgi:hypothetical protein